MAVSRIPLAPRRLFSFDDVNLACAAQDFDPNIGHPQPPFYPLFVAQMRPLNWLGLDRPESVLLVLSRMVGTAALLTMVWAGERLLGRGTGFCAALLLLFQHSFWYGGLTRLSVPNWLSFLW